MLWLAAALVLAPIVLAGLVVGGLNTEAGRTLAESQIAGLTGGTVSVAGLSGRFPDRLRLGRLEIRDGRGVWLAADGVALDWSPLALLHKQALVHRLEAATLSMPRLPASEAAADPAPSKPFSLPVRVTVESLAIKRAELGGPVMGAAAVLALQGRADLPSLASGSATLRATRLDGGGTYALDGRADASTIDARVVFREPEGGLLAQLAGLPALGVLSVTASAAGPRHALVTAIDLAAGPLSAQAHGTIDLLRNAADMDVTAAAPAMAPAPGVSWRGVSLQAHVAGPFTAPNATGRLRAEGLAAAGAEIGSLDATLSGNAGTVAVKAAAMEVRLPGPAGDLLAGSPVTLDASARLDQASRPVRFVLEHKLIKLDGTATTGSALLVDATVGVPELGPFAILGGIDLAGSTTLKLHALQEKGSTAVELDGTVGLTAGPAPAPALLGTAARLGVSARIAGTMVTVSRATLDGAALRLDAHGSSGPDGIDVIAKAGVSDLALIAPTIEGQAQLDAHVQGPLDRLALDATVTGDVGAAGVKRGPVRLGAHLAGLPAAPSGRIYGEGTLDGAPVSLGLNAARDADGTLHATIDRADWQSLHAEGALVLASGATIPQGRVALRFQNLADLRRLVGQPLGGSLNASVALDASVATIEAEARNAGLPGNAVGHVLLRGRVTDPMGHPAVNATMAADGIAAAGVTGSAKIEATGPEEALAVRVSAGITQAGTQAQVAGQAVLDAPGKQVRLQTLQVAALGETARLLGPAVIRYGDGVAVDRLRVGVRQAVLEIAGRLSPSLQATASLRTPADLIGVFAPELALDGAIVLDARLSGPAGRPDGTVTLAATGVRLRTDVGRAMPAANLTASARLSGGSARLDARVAAGSATLVVAGQAPLGAGPLDLRATGALDLALLDPILSAQGRRVRGRLALDGTVGGTIAVPRIAGTATLADGEVQDFSQGVRLTGLAGSVRAEGDTVRVVGLSGRAGSGTVGISGTVGVLAPGMPVDLAVTMRNARPLASDLVSVDVDADVTVRGFVANGLQAAGRATIRRAELQIPNNLPASVAVLNVRRPGDKPVAAAAPGAAIGLDLTVEAPGQVFVRGRGVDAEMSGSLRIRGSSIAPQVGGGLEMRRGAISVAGTTLTFSRGKVGFDGTGVNGKIDPTLDFAADSTTSSVTATLAITGYVSKPKITLTSTPDLPQDEVLAYLVFKRGAKDLGPFQIAQIAAGLAELSGVTGGGGFNPLETVRKGLGLDRLALGSSSSSTASGSTSASSSPTVEAGRYVANGIYVGAKQGTSGSQTQATVQIDITKGLKLETDVGSGQGGNQVGLTYQFDY